jgi:5-methylcytosine-specific restriction endonuclease McrA
VTTRDPSVLDPALDPSALDRRLHERTRAERNGQVDFLIDLELFDRREDFLRAGFGSLWDYCRRSLHLREGATHRRITAMRLLRRFPGLEAPLRDGRLCLTTVSVLREVLTEENVEELVAKAAFLSKAETEHLVATLRPRAAPREGIRKLPTPVIRQALVHPATARQDDASATRVAAIAPSAALNVFGLDAAAPAAPPAVAQLYVSGPRRPEFEPISADVWALRVNIDGTLKAELETLAALLSHKLPKGDLSSILREAVACAIEKHGKRKGAVRPARTRTRRRAVPSADASNEAGAEANAAASNVVGVEGGEATRNTAGAEVPSRTIPAEVRRQVWERDGGRCTFTAPDGQRCGSRYQVEPHHLVPVARGGLSTVENLGLHCHAHNLHEAEVAFGGEHMARFRRRPLGASRTGEFTSSRRGAAPSGA